MITTELTLKLKLVIERPCDDFLMIYFRNKPLVQLFGHWSDQQAVLFAAPFIKL